MLELVVTALGIIGILIGTRGRLYKTMPAFDAIYEGIFTKPYSAISLIMRADPIRAVYRLFVWVAGFFQYLLAMLQTGNLAHYVSALVIAILLVLGFAVFS
jgi:hypothetical protein